MLKRSLQTVVFSLLAFCMVAKADHHHHWLKEKAEIFADRATHFAHEIHEHHHFSHLADTSHLLAKQARELAALAGSESHPPFLHAKWEEVKRTYFHLKHEVHRIHEPHHSEHVIGEFRKVEFDFEQLEKAMGHWPVVKN